MACACLHAYVPVVPQKLPGFAVGVAQVDSAEHAGSVQVSQVSDVRCVLRYLLLRAHVTVDRIKVG